jgi:hypothetical protein
MVNGCRTKQYEDMHGLVLDHIVVIKKNMRANHFTMIRGGGMRGMHTQFHVHAM